VSEDALRRALLSGHRLVRLEDGTYAPVAGEQVRDVLTRMAELFANHDLIQQKCSLALGRMYKQAQAQAEVPTVTAVAA